MSPQNFFENYGYWIESEPLFSSQDLAEYRQSMNDIMNHQYESGREPMAGRNWPAREDLQGMVQINNAWWAGGAISRLSLNRRIGQMAAQLLQVNGVYMWHDQLLYKPPARSRTLSGNIGWHQDWNYWQVCDHADLITAWVALNDVNTQNGAMMVIPGSHRWGQAMEASERTLEMDKTASEVKIPRGEKWEIVHCELQAGAVSFHHAKTIHGSGPNNSDQPRLGLAIHMVADHVRYTNQGIYSHSNLKVCPRKEGDLFRGHQHPVIWKNDTE